MSSDKDFKLALTEILKKGYINDAYIDKILSNPENMKLFRKAWTHPSFFVSGNEQDSYDFLELFGDGSIAEFTVYYLRYRFPDIKSVKWMTRLKHNIVGGKMLGRIAIQQGFVRFARYGPAMEESLRKYPHLESNVDYVGMMEDILEAFCGVMQIIITKDYPHGVFVEIIHAILGSFLADVEISLKYQDVFDSVTRLKELYESNKRGLKWPAGKKAGQTYEITLLEDGRTQVLAYGWPKGDRTPIPANRVRLGRAVEPTEEYAKEKAARMALETLENSYNILDMRLDPHTIVSKSWKSKMGKGAYKNQ